jgi:hypothetical protein
VFPLECHFAGILFGRTIGFKIDSYRMTVTSNQRAWGVDFSLAFAEQKL